jgi:hypothetical protein
MIQALDDDADADAGADDVGQLSLVADLSPLALSVIASMARDFSISLMVSL